MGHKAKYPRRVLHLLICETYEQADNYAYLIQRLRHEWEHVDSMAKLTGKGRNTLRNMAIFLDGAEALPEFHQMLNWLRDRHIAIHDGSDERNLVPIEYQDIHRDMTKRSDDGRINPRYYDAAAAPNRPAEGVTPVSDVAANVRRPIHHED